MTKLDEIRAKSANPDWWEDWRNLETAHDDLRTLPSLPDKRTVALRAVGEMADAIECCASNADHYQDACSCTDLVEIARIAREALADDATVAAEEE